MSSLGDHDDDCSDCPTEASEIIDDDGDQLIM
jgi:hypothetical protein